ncbi:TetR/AcrR family transcriptional regulator [soil metagenome]
MTPPGSRTADAAPLAAPKAARQRARKGEGDRTHEEILDAAESLLDRLGSEDAVSIRAVADVVGLTAPAIYRHFPDKAHLIFEVCERHFDRLDVEVVQPALATHRDDPVEAIRAIGHGYVRFGLENPEHYRIMFMGNADHTPELYAEKRPLENGALGTTVALVQRALDEGRLRRSAGDAVTITWVLWSGLHGALASKVAMPNMPGPALEQVVDAVFDVFLHGVLADPGHPSS